MPGGWVMSQRRYIRRFAELGIDEVSPRPETACHAAIVAVSK
jgi:hypothetical protein